MKRILNLPKTLLGLALKNSNNHSPVTFCIRVMPNEYSNSAFGEEKFFVANFNQDSFQGNGVVLFTVTGHPFEEKRVDLRCAKNDMIDALRAIQSGSERARIASIRGKIDGISFRNASAEIWLFVEEKTRVGAETSRVFA